ncbi:MAG: NADH-quinone oxidoreductase subunit J [Elusimicrobia bacterium]|nr:NADH-quinone oxidoreductase subunit J [Elusimicrobiota bacterium]
MIVLAALAAGVVAVFFAGVMLLHRSLYVSAVSLLVVLLQTAVLFLLCGSPLLGLLQVMIYAGAVMVLVVVTIMAAGSEGERFADFSFPRPLAWLGLIAAAVEAAAILSRGGAAAAAVAVDPALQVRLGAALFKPYALATEAVTLLMFLAALAIAPDRGLRDP